MRQYYYHDINCPAESAYKDNCICWHDEGTGSYAEARFNDRKAQYLGLEWRTKPDKLNPKTLDQLQSDRLALVTKRDEANAKINTEIKDLTVRIQELCDHEWYWAQVAGEGRICSKCGKVDYDGD